MRVSRELHARMATPKGIGVSIIPSLAADYPQAGRPTGTMGIPWARSKGAWELAQIRRFGTDRRAWRSNSLASPLAHRQPGLQLSFPGTRLVTDYHLTAPAPLNCTRAMVPKNRQLRLQELGRRRRGSPSRRWLDRSTP